MVSLANVESYFPRTWTPVAPSSYLFKLFPISPFSAEYMAALHHLQDVPVKNIMRIQHPLSYMKYVLEKEKYKTNNSSDNDEEIVYHILHECDLNEAIRRNCDVRYYSQNCYFTSSPQKAKYLSAKENLSILLLKKQGQSKDMSLTKNHYPMYLLYV